MKLKQILALAGVFALVALYGATIVCAILDDPRTMYVLGTSLVLTVLIPTLIWFLKMFVGLSSPSAEEDYQPGDQTSDRDHEDK